MPSVELLSISEDSEWVRVLQESFCGWGIVSNHRCGTWYVPSELEASTCYFKSTDGHPESLQKHAMFGLRRLNLHLLEESLWHKYKGLIIVDSTKNPNKQFPDSFTRTIPVWCCIVNRVCQNLKSNVSEYKYPLTMHSSISSEEKQIVESLLDDKVNELEDILGIRCDDDTNGLKVIVNTLRRTAKPLQLFWCDKESLEDVKAAAAGSSEDYYPIILANPSIEMPEEPDHIKGAADDEETWAAGLTPKLFWKHKNLLLNDCSIPTITTLLQEQAQSQLNMEEFTFLPMGHSKIFVNSPTRNRTEMTLSSFQESNPFVMILEFSKEQTEQLRSSGSSYFHFPVGNYKKQRHAVETVLTKVLALVEGHDNSKGILLWSVPDYNVAMSVCLAILLKWYDLNGA